MNISGIDLRAEQNSRRDAKGQSGFRRLPYFGFAVGPKKESSIWQQSSDNNRNAWDVPKNSVPGGDRIVEMKGCRVGVLICGELFSARARESMSALRPDLVVDLGHAGMGTGVTRAMENMARNGRSAVAHTQHVAWGTSSLRFVAANGRRNSIVANKCDYVRDQDRWVSCTTRQI